MFFGVLHDRRIPALIVIGCAVFGGMKGFAAEKKIQVEWQFATFANTEKGVRPHIPEISPGAPYVTVTGIFIKEQLQKELQAAKGEFFSLPPATGNSGEEVTIKKQEQFTYTLRIVGDLSKYKKRTGLDGFTPKPDERLLGYDFKCKPTLGKDGFTIDLLIDLAITWLKGYEETILPHDGALFDTTTIAEDFPRLRQPVFNVKNVQTSVTVYDSQTVAFRLGPSATNSEWSDYAFVTVKVVDS